MKREWLAFLSAVQFLTRLPVPDPGWEKGRMDRAAKWFPAVGALVGLICGSIYFLCDAFLPLNRFETELAILAGVLVTGALHEDGLADTADGLGGNTDRARTLEIMRDSHIGTYGVIALIFAFVLRFTAYDSVFFGAGAYANETTTLLAVFLASHATSRFMMLGPIAVLDYARGAEDAPIGMVSPIGLAIALTVTCCACVPLVSVHGVGAMVAGFIASGVVTFAFTRLIRNRLGGWTGDTAGAAQVFAEIAFVLGVVLWTWS